MVTCDWQLSGMCSLQPRRQHQLPLGPLLQTLKASLRGAANPKKQIQEGATVEVLLSL